MQPAICGVLAVQVLPRLVRGRRCRPVRAQHVRMGLASSSSSGSSSLAGLAAYQTRSSSFERSPTSLFATSDDSSTPSSSSSLAWPVSRVRKEFINFFTEKKEHRFVPSSPVVPLNDPTLLFANSGMCQFKPIFMGQLDPSSPLQGVKRAANSQKCIRAGGKHNDLDDVGKDVYHHTFFEMLGNWSFGDYFKTEAIDMAWELLTEVYGLEKERLYASYFRGDEELGLPVDLEAKALWERYLPPSRVLPYGKKENFWEMGAVGPCGPCSELHYDRIGGRDASSLVNGDDPDVIEIWNLVFMQFYRDEAGKLTQLPNQHIDTGMGLERVTSILQNKRSNYDTDIFSSLFSAIHEQVGGEPYHGKLGDKDPDLRDTAYRVIADHVRTLTLAIADGAMPSTEGRGYVLRRILRRAVRFGRQKLGAKPGFFSQLVPTVVKSLAGAFPDLEAAAARVQTVISEEEVAFDRTVERGMQTFEGLRQELAKTDSKIVPGDQAFLLYDALGFPLDLTEQMAQEAGLSVDVKGFEAAMERQKQRSRDALRDQQALEMGMRALELVAEQTAWLEREGIKVTEDALKYDWDISPTVTVKAIFSEQGFVNSTSELPAGASVGFVLDRTSFYAESGGQVSDVGQLKSVTDSTPLLEVKSVNIFGGYILHNGLLQGSHVLTVGDEVACQVNYEHRRQVAPNHTMTHALNWALREVLGDGINQRGSMVTSERLRFDFSCESAASLAQLKQVEELVQELIQANVPVTCQEASLAQAQAITGLRAVAGESYPDPVRVVTIGRPISEVLASPSDPQWLKQSVEFCGGTHIKQTAEAQAFALLEDKAISKGVRRITAVTGALAQTAKEAGQQVLEKLADLEKEPDEKAVLELGQHIDSSELSAALKAECRDRVGELRKKLKKMKKKNKA
jgi:alanyl-tRNA synthetase